MPSGVGLEIVVAVALAILLVAVMLASRGRRAREDRPPRIRAVAPARDSLGGRVRALFGHGAVEDVWPGLEDLLLKADVGPSAAAALVEGVRARFADGADPAALLTDAIAETFEGDPPFAPPAGEPAVIMVVGVNGSGKTTTIGKLAAYLAREGRSVCLAGSDTFRAAAAEQLEKWAERAGADLVAQSRGADPGAVAFDAVRAAQARGAGVLIVDTAGRLHTRVPLMEELKKVRRVLERAGGPVEETLLVLDATTGQNGIAQARAFTEATPVTGVVLAKLDGTAKGGIVLSVRTELGIPVKLVGTGEGIDDLAAFDARGFARALVSG